MGVGVGVGVGVGAWAWAWARGRVGVGVASTAVAYMLRHQTPTSLLIIDEFGKGTSKEDGVALLAGVIRHLVTRCTKAIGAWCRLMNSGV